MEYVNKQLRFFSLNSFLLLFSLILTMASCTKGSVIPEPETVDKEENPKQEEESNNSQQSNTYNMNITINGRTLSASMLSNSSTKALKEILEKSSITYTANDYGGFEKVGNIGHSLPSNNEQITTAPGDIILYQGNSICLYYGQNSWNFTRLGKINFSSEAELKQFLNAGGGSITVTLSLSSN